MTHKWWTVAAALCAGLSIACGEGRRAPETAEVLTGDSGGVRPEPVSVRGCLTEAGGRFALTEIEATGRTRTYQLAGADEQLRPHVGREVDVAGEAEPAQVADVREATPPATPGERPTGTTGQAGTEPNVRTESHARLETRTLRVSSVTPTGDECPAAARGERQ